VAWQGPDGEEHGKQESLITFRRNTDHDHPGIAITIVRESLITIPRNPHLSHAASPEIINGEYVLNSHGKIGHISERHYLILKGWELRLFASGWIVFYFAIMMHWWYPRRDEWTVVMPD
jgi:hypothetical protein